MNSKSFKKVLLILPINSGTMAIRAYDLYFFLKKNNVNVAVAILKNSENPVFKFENEYIFESRVKSIFRIIVKTLWLKKIKNKFKPDISISVLNGCSIVNLLSGGNDFKIGMFRAPVEQLRDWNGEFHTTNFTYRFLFSRLDKLYCVSEGIRKSILENYPQIKKEKVETVYNLFDIEKIKLLGKEPIDVDFFDKYKVIVNIGRIEKIKEQERLIRAYSLLDDQTKKETKLVFIGDNKTEYFNEISQLINDLNLNENILFLGEVKNPYKYISKSKIFVLSSIQEGLPGVLIEALILEVPVISTNSSYGVWEILSSESEYDKKLSTMCITKSGIITSNLLVEDVSNKDLDIKNLCEALRYLIKNENNQFDFNCIDKFRQENIIEKYINPTE